MSSFTQQRGLVSMGTLYLILSLGFFVYLTFTLAPPYFDNMFIQSALKDLGQDERALKDMSSADVRTKLRKNFQINNIRGDVTEKVKVVRKAGAIVVSVNYEKRLPLFDNAEIVLTFENQWNSKYPQKCCKPDTSEKP